MSFSGALIAILVFWMSLGIIYQICDLRSAIILYPTLNADQRCGLYIELFWRVAALALIIIYSVISFLLDRKNITFADWDFWFPEGTARLCVVLMPMIILVGSVPRGLPKTRSKLYAILEPIAYIMAALFFFERCFDDTLIPYLVHIATIGINNAQPLKYSAVNPQLYNYYASVFFWWSILSLLIVIANYVMLRSFANQWKLGSKRRLFWLSFLVVGIMAGYAFVIWTTRYGLYKLSPFFAETWGNSPWQCWAASALLMVILTTLITYKMSVRLEPAVEESLIIWWKSFDKYYHEKQWILILLAISIIWFHYETYFALQGSMRKMYASMGLTMPAFTLRELIESWFNNPADYLFLCLVILSLHRAFIRRKVNILSIRRLPEFNLNKFIVVWITSAGVIISGAIVIVWMSFALWFNPWFRGRWP